MRGEGSHFDGRTQAAGIATGLTAAAGAIGDIAGDAYWAPWCYWVAAGFAAVTIAIFASSRADRTRAVPVAPPSALEPATRTAPDSVPATATPIDWRSATPLSRSGETDAGSQDWNTLLGELDRRIQSVPTRAGLPRLGSLVGVLARLVPRWSHIEASLKLAGVPREELALDQTAGPPANWLEGVERALDYECLSDLLDQVHRQAAPRPQRELEIAVRETVERWEAP